MELVILFAFLSYGLCFGFANKLPFLYSDTFLEEGEKATFLDKLLTCPYCLGFHCGWLSALLLWGSYSFPPLPWQTIAFGLVIAGFASSAWCYIVDTATRSLEGEEEIYEEDE